MARRGSFRASDADREHVAELLRRAAAEGRLLTEELEHRLGTALSARTYGELDPLVADLPGGRKSGTLARRRPSGLMIAGSIVAIAIVMLAVLAVLLLALGLFAIWGVWIVLAWACFGGRRRAIPKRRAPGGRYSGVYWASGGYRGRPVQPRRPGYRL